MPKYLFLMYNEKMEMPNNPTPEQIENGTKPWRDYIYPLEAKGTFVSANPVSWEGKMLTETGVEDYQPQKIDFGGYMIITANDMDEAIEIAKQSPSYKMKAGPITIRKINEVNI